MLRFKNISHNTLFLGFSNALFPKQCAVCRENLLAPEQEICLHCESSFWLDAELLESDGKVAQLFWGKVEVEFAGAVFNYIKGGRMQEAVHQFKYKGNQRLAFEMGRIMANEFLSLKLEDSFDYILPVPSSKKKLRKRGYNQSLELAKGFSYKSGIPIFSTALKKGSVDSQTDKKVLQRYQNILNSIRPTKKLKQLTNKKVLLIDDVITTGATLNACAQVLKENVAIEVSILALAYRNI